MSDNSILEGILDAMLALRLGIKAHQPYLTFHHEGILRVAIIDWTAHSIYVWTPQSEFDRQVAEDCRRTEQTDDRFNHELKD